MPFLIFMNAMVTPEGVLCTEFCIYFVLNVVRLSSEFSPPTKYSMNMILKQGQASYRCADTLCLFLQFLWEGQLSIALQLHGLYIVELLIF